MISQSLRNHRTTLWSTLRKTSSILRWTLTAECSPAIIAVLATCTILAGSHPAKADDSAGRATLSGPENPLPPDSLSGPIPETESALRSTPVIRQRMSTAEAAGIRTLNSTDKTEGPPQVARERSSAPTTALANPSKTIAGKPQTSTVVHPATTTANFSRANDAAPSASEKIIRRTSDETVVRQPAEHAPVTNEKPPVQIETWGQEYSMHVDDVLTGGVGRCEQESVGDWWRRRLPYVEMVTVEPGQIGASARTFIIDHALPPEHDYDVDIYDQKPIAIASSHTIVADRSAATDDSSTDAAVPGKNRLKTDIRSIRPTLSYAMRNIEASQLPTGFHEKLDQGEYIARQASPAVLQWAPTNLYYHPLYFEDPSLERYGHTYHPVVQPFASAGRFATQLVGLPYQMVLHPVHSREYALGYYRPGECAPKKHYQIPFNEEAAVVQAAAMVGFFFIFP